MSLQAKTRQEIAAEYGISPRTLTRWLQKYRIDIPSRDRLSPKVVALIYEVFGCPITSNKSP